MKRMPLADQPLYLNETPTSPPRNGLMIVHNFRPSSPRQRLSRNGFRAWFARPGQHVVEVCDCGWAPKAGQHFTRLMRET